MSNEEKFKKALERIVFLCGPQEKDDTEKRAIKSWGGDPNTGYCEACMVEGREHSCWVPKIKAIAEEALKE